MGPSGAGFAPEPKSAVHLKVVDLAPLAGIEQADV